MSVIGYVQRLRVREMKTGNGHSGAWELGFR
jgi:hypothetical protein